MMSPEEFLKAEEVWVYDSFKQGMRKENHKCRPISIEKTDKNKYIYRVEHIRGLLSYTHIFKQEDVYPNPITEQDLLKTSIKEKTKEYLEQEDKLNTITEELNSLKTQLNEKEQEEQTNKTLIFKELVNKNLHRTINYCDGVYVIIGYKRIGIKDFVVLVNKYDHYEQLNVHSSRIDLSNPLTYTDN